MKSKPKMRLADPSIDFESYFKVGISQDYILIRQDFPVGNIPPGEFSRLIRAMFAKNDEVLDAKK